MSSKTLKMWNSTQNSFESKTTLLKETTFIKLFVPSLSLSPTWSYFYNFIFVIIAFRSWKPLKCRKFFKPFSMKYFDFIFVQRFCFYDELCFGAQTSRHSKFVFSKIGKNVACTKKCVNASFFSISFCKVQ